MGMTIFWSCQQSPVSEEQLSADNSENVKKIIDEKNAQAEAWYKAGLVDSVATFFADNIIQMPPNQPPIVGIEKFKESWNQSMQFGQWEFSLKAQEVKQSGDVAVELGKYTLEFTPNENSPIPAINDKGNYVVLWEKIDGNWKVVWDAPVSELPLPTPVPETEAE
jgi:ketosteroid isomerase-like protein